MYSTIEQDIEKMVETNKEKLKPKTLTKQTDQHPAVEKTSPIKGTHIKKRDKNPNKHFPEKKEKPTRVLNGIELSFTLIECAVLVINLQRNAFQRKKTLNFRAQPSQMSNFFCFT